MCNASVIRSVTDRMLSRRHVLGGGATLAGGAALATGGVRPALAAGGAVADLTHALSTGFPTYFGEPGFFMEPRFRMEQDGFNLFELRINEHTGTHMDAPLHFSADGQSVDAVPVEKLVVPLCVVDIRARAAADPDTRLTPDDLRAWIDANGPLPDGACVAMNSGWAAHAATERFRNADGDGAMHFPGIHVETVAMLMEESAAVGIAVDTLSLDHGISADFATHFAWLPTNRWGLECVANLDTVPAAGATLVVGAPKFTGGTGGPSRLLALL